MSEEQQMDSQNEEVVQPQNDEHSSEVIQEVQKDDSQERNFKELRHSRDELRNRLEELESRYQDETSNLGSKKSQEPPEEDLNLADDDLVEGRHVKKMLERLENKMNSYQQQSSTVWAQNRLKGEFQDFDSVVTRENIKLLEQTEPELASTLVATQDPYAAGKSAYKLLKSMGIYKEDAYVGEKKRAEDNSSKPRPTQSISPQQGNSPLSHANAFANGLTPELKKQLYSEMMNARREG